MVPGCTIIHDQRADIKCYRAVSARIENAAQKKQNKTKYIQGLLRFVQQRFVKSRGHSVCALPWRVILKGEERCTWFFSVSPGRRLGVCGWPKCFENQKSDSEKKKLRKKNEGKQSGTKLIDARHGRVVRRQSTFQNKPVGGLSPYLDVFWIKNWVDFWYIRGGCYHKGMTQIAEDKYTLFKYLCCPIMQLIAGKIFIVVRKELLIWYPLERKGRGWIYKPQPQKCLGKLCFAVNIC